MKVSHKKPHPLIKDLFSLTISTIYEVDNNPTNDTANWIFFFFTSVAPSLKQWRRAIGKELYKSKQRFWSTDGNLKWAFRMPGDWSLPDFQTNRLYYWRDAWEYKCCSLLPFAIRPRKHRLLKLSGNVTNSPHPLSQNYVTVR